MNTKHTPGSRTSRTRKMKRKPIDQLCPNSLHRLFFDPTPEEKIEAIANALKKGQQPPGPIEVTPGGTVLIGMPSVEAALRAGWKEVEVAVRLDLNGLSIWAEELEVLDLHLVRGGLGPIDRVRCLAYAHEIKDKVPQKRWREYHQGTLEEAVMRHLGVSKRSAERYLSLVDLPLPIRQAFEKGSLRIATAEGVKNLSTDAHKAIADAIAAGTDPVEVVAGYLRPRRSRPKPPSVLIRKYVARLKEAQEALPEGGDGPCFLTPADQDTLRLARDTTAKLLAACQTIDEAQQQAKREALRLGLASGRNPALPAADHFHHP